MLARLKLGHNQFFERGPPSPPPRSQLGKAFNNFNSFPSGPQGRFLKFPCGPTCFTEFSCQMVLRGCMGMSFSKETSKSFLEGILPKGLQAVESPHLTVPFPPLFFGGATGIHFVRPPLTRRPLKGANLFPVFFTLWMFGCILGLYLLVETPVFH